MGTDTLTRIETLSANEALLQSRLGECVNTIRHLARICKGMPTTTDEEIEIIEARIIADRAEQALRASHDAGQAERGEP